MQVIKTEFNLPIYVYVYVSMEEWLRETTLCDNDKIQVKLLHTEQLYQPSLLPAPSISQHRHASTHPSSLSPSHFSPLSRRFLQDPAL